MRDKMSDALAQVAGWMPGLPELPRVLPRAEVPVYLIHKGRGAEDYFFVFDFEEFVTKSREGVFVRPALAVHAGRDDFDRVRFAGHFRESFATAFDEMRLALAAEQTSKAARWGWFGVMADGALLAGSALGAVSLFILGLALLAGRAALPSLRMPKLWSRKTDEAKLEDEIADLRGRVDRALTRIDVVMHPELQLQAIRKGGPGDPDDIEFGDWPLPPHVMAHLEDGQSSAVWGQGK